MPIRKSVATLIQYAWNCGAGYPARGPAFQRVLPPRKAAAGKIACPTWLRNTLQEFRRRPQAPTISVPLAKDRSRKAFTTDFDGWNSDSVNPALDVLTTEL